MSARPAVTLLCLLFALAVPSVHAADSAAASTGITDAERSSRLKDEAKALRDEAEATFLATEPKCYAHVLVNRCIDQAKQERLATIKRARALEAEARKLDLAERQRAAAQTGRRTTDAPLSPSAPSTDDKAIVQPTPEAEVTRGERASSLERAEAEARAARAARDAERAGQRSAAEAEAAARAEQAARDRARYDERLREYEEKKARESSGR